MLSRQGAGFHYNPNGKESAPGARLIMFARKIRVEILDPGASRACPVEWLDNFCMRSFTGRSAFDDTLPVADGLLEVGTRVDLNSLQSDLEDWLTRKFGGGAPIRLRLTERGKSTDGPS